MQLSGMIPTEKQEMANWGAFASHERKLPSNLQKSAVATTLGNTLAVFFTLSFERDLIDTLNYDDKINLFN